MDEAMSLGFSAVRNVAMVVAIGCVMSSSPVRADDPRLAKCSTLTDRLMVLIQGGGGIERARRFKARLDSCIQLQRSAVERDARRILKLAPK